MSWQTPGGDPPPDPAAPTSPVPVTPSAEPLVPEPAPESTPTALPQGPTAAPVGWAAPDQAAASGARPGGPEVAWAPPAPAVAVPMGEGLVIAGTFSRVVAYSIDSFLLGLLNVIVASALGAYGRDSSAAVVIGIGLAFIVVNAVYFVALWRSDWHATVGMRLIGVRVLRAVDGGTLSMNAAVIRWIALSGLVSVVAVTPVASGLLGLLGIIWVLALLITTATHPLRQGLHDRWAGSVVVQPAPGGSGAAIVGCFVLIFAVFAFLFVLLGLASDQIQDILSQVGNSI